MLYTLDGGEIFNEETMSFEKSEPMVFDLQHTLYNLDLWESKYRKRLLDNDDITLDEYRDYIDICSNGDSRIPKLSDTDIIDMVKKLISDQPTATLIPKSPNSNRSGRQKFYTSEIIYAYMYIMKIDSSWEHKNLNKLLILISAIGDIKNGPKKMDTKSAAIEQRAMIEQRRREAEERAKRRGVG